MHCTDTTSLHVAIQYLVLVSVCASSMSNCLRYDLMSPASSYNIVLMEDELARDGHDSCCSF